jgi:hypothetical protein
MCGYMACMLEFHGSVCCAFRLSAYAYDSVSGLEQEPVAGCCDYDDCYSGLIKGGEFLDLLRSWGGNCCLELVVSDKKCVILAVRVNKIELLIWSFCFVHTICNHPRCFVCPDLLVVVCVTSYGIQEVIHQITYSQRCLFINLFIFIWGAMSELVQLIK